MFELACPARWLICRNLARWRKSQAFTGRHVGVVGAAEGLDRRRCQLADLSGHWGHRCLPTRHGRPFPVTATSPVVVISTAAALGSGSASGALGCERLDLLQEVVGVGDELDLFAVDRAPILPAGAQPDRGHHHRERRRILREELLLDALTAAVVFEVDPPRTSAFRRGSLLLFVQLAGHDFDDPIDAFFIRLGAAFQHGQSIVDHG
jgi:hypothetical protein